MSQSLKVTVLKGESLIGKTKGTSDPYVEVIVFDDKLAKVGKPQCTRVIKNNLDPNWNQALEFKLARPPKESFSIKICVWDKHTFRTDKFMGQCSIQFNAELINSEDVIESWFPLSVRKVNEAVSGKINLKIQYGTLKEKKKAVSLQEMKDENKIKDPKPPKEGELPLQAKGSLDELKKSGMRFLVMKEDIEEYDSIRNGPASTSMKPIGAAGITITKGLILTQNGAYSLEPAKGDVVVTAGKWFFEVKLNSYSQLQIGWCTEDYNHKTNMGDSWTYDGNSQQKLRKANGSQYGQRWNYGDTIGVALDLDERSLKFFKNGQNLGEAFGKSEFPKNCKLSPFVNLSSRANCTFNFGKENFTYPQKGYNPLHCFLSEKEISDLAKLFDHYKKISNEADDVPKEDWVDTIHEAGIDDLIKDLEIKDNDTGFLVLSWKLSCDNAFEISRDEWMNNLTIHACSKIKDIISKISEWKKDVLKDDSFKNFYNWCFKYMRGDKKKLETEQCKSLWDLLLKPKNWALYKDWNDYLEDKKVTSISEDCWKMMIEFSLSCSKNVDNYDDKKAWPVEIDGFVDWMNGDGGEGSEDDDL
eukprot:TRINITY_DN1212_c0_g1_i1.p1 TRINITY_DN1212_c0_g1~~TRINITY_DN1212_c0_g1_i1.p1  ORF type:complete len:586 (+),score=188.95 TRINITY_DN1212_c0_g1_i1:54-1811(+)